MSCSLVENLAVLQELPPCPARGAALPSEARLSPGHQGHTAALASVARHPPHGICTGHPAAAEQTRSVAVVPVIFSPFQGGAAPCP